MPNYNMPPGPGRPKGSPNKATTKAREAIAAFVDDNAGRVSKWLDEIYEKDGPKDALYAFQGFLEYHVPKLARQEIAGDPSAPIQHLVKWGDE